MTNEELLQIIEQAALDKEIQLDLSASTLTELPPEIGKLTQLTSLNLKENKLTSLPPEIGQLTNLKRLHLSQNKLTSLSPEIGKLTQLEKLFLTNNKLTELPPEIGQLTELQQLYLSDNELTTLPPEIQQLTKLSNLDLRKNRLSVSNEILDSIHKPNLIIKYCLQDNPDQKKALKQIKMLLLGDEGVGKTSILKQLTGENFNQEEKKTQGINLQSISLKVNQEDITVNIWDFGGDQINQLAHPLFFSQRSLYLIVIDAAQGQKSKEIEYWLKMNKTLGDSSPVIIVANKSDQNILNIDRGRLRNKYPNIKAFIETSCLTSSGIDDLKKAIQREIVAIPHIYEELSPTWFTVKERLEQMSVGYLPYNDYQFWCQSEGIPNEQDQEDLWNLLQDAGLILCFQNHPKIENDYIINPQWLVTYIYQVLNRNFSTIIDAQIFNKIVSYPLDMNSYLFLMNIMQNSEICYESSIVNNFIFPHVFTKEFPSIKDWENSLEFKFKYNISPVIIMVRLIVRLKDYVYQNSYANNSCLFATEDSQALVKLERKNKEIIVLVKGQEESRDNFLEFIRYQLEDLDPTDVKIPTEESTDKVASEPNIEISESQPTTEELAIIPHSQVIEPKQKYQNNKKLPFIILAVVMALITVISFSLKLGIIPIIISGLLLLISLYFVWQNPEK